jgi:hypothetical protein
LLLALEVVVVVLEEETITLGLEAVEVVVAHAP